MITTWQIKKIHTLKSVIGLEEDLYRDMLASFGVYSSKDLTSTEGDIFIEILEDKIKSSKSNCSKKYEDFAGRDEAMATPAQLRKIEVVWADIKGSKDRDILVKSLRAYIKRQFHVDDIRFITKARAAKIIAILEKIKLKNCLKAI